MLYFLKILTSNFLDEELCIRLYLTLISEAPRLSFCLKDGVAEIIIAVVYEIHLKACVRYHRSINWHKSEIRAQTVTAFPFLNRGTEGNLSKRRIIINDSSRNILVVIHLVHYRAHRTARLMLLCLLTVLAQERRCLKHIIVVTALRNDHDL